MQKIFGPKDFNRLIFLENSKEFNYKNQEYQSILQYHNIKLSNI